MSPGWRTLVMVAALAVLPPAAAENIRTADILKRTADATFACMQWTPVGLCFWLQCSLLSCEVQSSLKIGHYNPDLVVSSYNELGNNPWLDIRGALGEVQRTAAKSVLGQLTPLPIDSAGNRSEGGREQREHKNLMFRETDAIGHPALSLPRPTGYTCASAAHAFRPYLLSALDALSWRHAMPEALYPASVMPGLRELGHWPRQTWGSVYPRNGWSLQAEEPKAAALTAQRAGDIVTRAQQPHVYWPLSDPASSQQRVWPPEALREGDASTGYWQMVSPVTDEDCQVFGTDDVHAAVSWSGNRVDSSGDYVWNLWRPYQCCERAGQLFLFDLNWRDYP